MQSEKMRAISSARNVLKKHTQKTPKKRVGCGPETQVPVILHIK